MTRTNLHEQRILAGIDLPLNLLNEYGYDSPGLYLEIVALSDTQVKRTQKGLTWVLGHGLQDKLVIVGGTAVAFHAAPRPLTPDLDFVCQNVTEVASLLAADGITPVTQLNPQHPPVGAGIHAEPFDTDFMTLTDPRLFPLVLSTSVPGRLGGGTFRFVSAPMLFAMKNMTGREKDLADAVKLLGTLKAQNLVPQTRELLKTMRKQRVMSKELYDDASSFLF
jgi:hypothetical protein